MSRLGWKLFTAYDAYAVGRLWYGSFQLETLPVSWLHAVIQALGVLGLAGYSWQLRIGRPWMWKVVAAGQLVYVLSLPLVILSLGHPAEDWTPVLTLFGRVIAYGLVKAYPLVRYGFDENALWRRGE